MKGFLKRDFLYARFFLMAGMAMTLLTMVALAVMFDALGKDVILLMSLLINMSVFALALFGAVTLFSYDELSGWRAYAATVPDGRQDQVTARYLLVAIFNLAAVVLAGGVSFGLGGVDSLLGSLMVLGWMLLEQAIPASLAYRFGFKGLLGGVMVLGFGFGVLMGGIILFIPETVWETVSGQDFAHLSDFLAALGFPPMGTLALALVLVGLAAFLISYLISLRIMARKEL